MDKYHKSQQAVISWSPQASFYAQTLPVEAGPDGEDINANYRWFQLLFRYFFSPDPGYSRPQSKTRFLEIITCWLMRNQGVTINRDRLERDLSVIEISLRSRHLFAYQHPQDAVEELKRILSQNQERRKKPHKILLSLAQYTQLIRHIEGLEA